MAAIDWANLSVAASFIVGCVVGGVAVARITRMVMDYLVRRQDRDDV